MSTTQTPPGSELFDGSQYDLPIPELDGHRADTLRIAVGGSIDLDLYDQHALDWLNQLKLGQNLELTVTLHVTSSSWRHSVKGEDQQDHVIHQVALKATSIHLPTAD